jgi:glyoxylase-like metal-dependent hydrolase (beta-lactamase superfamily II)
MSTTPANPTEALAHPRRYIQPAGTTDLSAGFLTRELTDGVFLVSNGNYQTIFMTTGEGVVLYDAPTPLVEFLPTAIADVTDEQITTLIYSHGHTDHIGGAGQIVRPGMEIVAERGTARFLEVKNDPARPQATIVYDEQTVLTRGNRTIELFRDSFHSADGDTVLFLRKEKVMVAIDLMAAGWVPLLDFDISENLFGYIGSFDRFLAYDFDFFISGHTADAATRQDVEITRDYVFDVYETVKRVHDEVNREDVLAEDRDNEQLEIKHIIEEATRRATAEIHQRWLDGPMKAVDLWAESHARAMVLYVRWTD